MPKIFGRDPAMWTAVIQAALLAVLAFELFGLTDAHVPLIMAVVNGVFGVVNAIYTKRAALSFIIGLLQAMVALAAGFGFTLTEQQTTAVIGLSTVVLSMFNWAVNSPATNPGLREEYDLAA